MTCNAAIRRVFAALGAAFTAAVLVPAAASATTTWFGSSLNHDPANAGATCGSGSHPPMCTHVGSFYPGTSGRVRAGATGTITKIKVRPQSGMTLRFELVHLRNVSSNHMHGQAKLVKQGPKLNVKGPTTAQADNGIYPTRSFPVSIPVHKGDVLAIATRRNQAEYCANGDPGQLTFFGPALSIGEPFRHNSGVDDCLLLVQAVIRH
jgi:hypothetical protein